MPTRRWRTGWRTSSAFEMQRCRPTRSDRSTHFGSRSGRCFDYCGDLIADRSASTRRSQSSRHVSVASGSSSVPPARAQWGAARLMAELGQVAAQVRDEIGRVNGTAHVWVERYTGAGSGWYRLDQAQRRLEAWLTRLDDVPDDRPLGVVRRAYEDVCQAMAEGFIRTLVGSDWAVPGMLHQTRIFSGCRLADNPSQSPTSSSTRCDIEMGVELADRLPATAEVTVRPAVGSLPSITPVGMAALHPGADTSFSVVEQGGKLGALIDGVFLPDLPARQKFAKARIPEPGRHQSR